jgi:cytochrome d ubiquinol oxidase subunit I
MDVVWLSRLQFAAATYFHFLFVPLTLGLSILVAVMETRYARGGDPLWQRLARFWGQLFLINFAVGIVTGITLEFQFGTNWSRYSEYVGDVFGSLLAIEATAAFFLESTFIGIWIFGWKKLSAKAHAVVMWLVALASNLSAIWILTANAWMQHPVGYTINQASGRAELTDFLAVVTQRAAVLKVVHTLSGAYVLAAFFVMGISAYHLLRKQHQDFFRRSFRLALTFGLVFSIVELVQGHLHAADVAETQPTKLAAMESHWQTGPRAPIYLLAIPDEDAGRNAVAMLPLPGALSLLAFHDPSAVVKGLADFPQQDRPPVLITFVAFRLMVALGAYFAAVTLLGWLRRNRLEEWPWFLKLMLCSIPLPYLAMTVGWTVAEVGRQPWIVYGLMRTRDAASPIASGQVLVTLIGFVVVYGILGLLAFGLMVRTVRRGPEAVPAPAGEGTATTAAR